MNRSTLGISIIIVFHMVGCYNHRVDTTEKWCEQINGKDLQSLHQPFWAAFFSVSFDGDAIRDDYVRILDQSYLDKVERRTDRMAWREKTNLHLVNLSSLMVIDPEEFISAWRHGIETSKRFSEEDATDRCLYGTVTSLFDTLYIHSMTADQFGHNWKDHVVAIPTERETRLGEDRL